MATHPYEARIAYHYHNSPCVHCGKTARHSNHQMTAKVPDACGLCGEAHADHRPATDLSAAFCMSRHSLPGDRFIRS